MAAAVISIFGVASAFANDFVVLATFRFLAGFGIGGLTVPFDALTEFLPDAERRRNLLAMHCFWAFGTFLVVLFAYLTLGKDGNAQDKSQWCWRIFVILCSLPSILSLLSGIWWVPESPRWLTVKGQKDKALAILRHAATINGKDADELFPHGTELVTSEEPESDNPLKVVGELFAPRWRQITFLLWTVQIAQLFAYYGNIELTSAIFSSGGSPASDPGKYSFDYGPLFAGTMSEVLGLTIVIFLIERMGRINIQTIGFGSGGVLVLVLGILVSFTNSFGGQFTVSFFARMLLSAAASTTWLTTAEVYSTNVRATGGSLANTMARLGGFISPYLVASRLSYTVTAAIFMAVGLIAAVAVYSLPETTGVHLGAALLQHDHQADQQNVDVEASSSCPSESKRSSLVDVKV